MRRVWLTPLPALRGLPVGDIAAGMLVRCGFDRPDVRKRWVLRQRNKESVAEVADALAWSVAVSLDEIVPTEHLGRTVRAAVDAYVDDPQVTGSRGGCAEAQGTVGGPQGPARRGGPGWHRRDGCIH
ncbi:hypothetical protein ACFYT5_00180 [Streptomyces anulatus]|uniref:Uncharacterized protein n=1 Tax=Streptomyces anulatus TaxID=1892 RepID=A0ABZ1ZTL1_STRAQ|nr:hypothetical protein [Streptomyces anulatus]